MFPDDAAAETWFVEQRWPEGVYCPHCGSLNVTDASALRTFVREHVQPGATLYTDEAKSYAGMPEFAHEAVNHSAKEFVRGMASTNGMESFWAMLKRGYQGTLPQVQRKAP